MKLLHILFESSVSIANQVIPAMVTATKGKDDNVSATSESFFEHLDDYYDMHKLILDFTEKNHKDFESILKIATIFEFLGSGAYGDAYNLGNYVLKIELTSNGLDSSEQRGSKSLNALWGTKKLGIAVPMIYDSGYMEFHGKKYYWEIKEKFETINQSEHSQEFVDAFNSILHALSNPENTKLKQKDVKLVGETLRLAKDWHIKLAAEMEELKNQGMSDFHSGNIGIRRVGPEGYLYFFD